MKVWVLVENTTDEYSTWSQPLAVTDDIQLMKGVIRTLVAKRRPTGPHAWAGEYEYKWTIGDAEATCSVRQAKKNGSWDWTYEMYLLDMLSGEGLEGRMDAVPERCGHKPGTYVPGDAMAVCAKCGQGYGLTQDEWDMLNKGAE